MVSVCRHWAELLSAPLDITWKGEGSVGKANDSQVGGYDLSYKVASRVVCPLSLGFVSKQYGVCHDAMKM